MQDDVAAVQALSPDCTNFRTEVLQYLKQPVSSLRMERLEEGV